METSAACVTETDAVPLMDPTVAVIVAEPTEWEVTNPPAATEATCGAAESQVAEEVKFLVVPSLYFPVEDNCKLRPSATEGSVGVTLIETRLALEVSEPVIAGPSPMQLNEHRQRKTAKKERE
jgi:hypothetical protein